MVGQELTNLETKVNSAEGNFSTSESTHSKQKNRAVIGQYPLNSRRESAQQIACNQSQRSQFLQQNVEDETEHRLFTFMDERDCQKKIIQNFFSKQANKHHCLSQSPLENNIQLLNIGNEGIQKIIEDSRKKREDFLKKLLNGNNVNKTNKSTSRLSKLNKSKTPRASHCAGPKYETIEPISKSKTPKFEHNRSITPKYEKDIKLFRAKSSLEKDWIKLPPGISHKKSIKQIEVKKQRYELNDDSSENLTTKALLKKKKQLEKQLTAVKQSLISRKKKSILPSNPIAANKKVNQIKYPQNKKSITKLSKIS